MSTTSGTTAAPAIGLETGSRLPAMQLQTSRFGEISVTADRMVECPDGLPGFESFLRFVLIEVDGDEGLVWLQSLDDGEVAFLAAAAFDFFPDYAFDVSDADEEALRRPDPDDLTVLVLLTIDREAEAITANLLAPVLINHPAKVARQVVLDADLPVAAAFGR